MGRLKWSSQSHPARHCIFYRTLEEGAKRLQVLCLGFPLPVPEKNHRLLDLVVQTSVDGASDGCSLDCASVRVIFGEGDDDLGGKTGNSSRRFRSHVFLDFHRRSGEVDLVALRIDPHDRHHARAQGGRDQVSGGIVFSTSVVVDGGVRLERGTRGAMGGRAAEGAFVDSLDFDHVREYWVRVSRGRFREE